MKIFFQATVITEELFCKPLRVLAVVSKTSAIDFKTDCARILVDLEDALDDPNSLTDLWTQGQEAMRRRLDSDIAKAVDKTTVAGRTTPVPPFVSGGGDAQKALPGTVQRLSVFGATIKGIIAAL